MQRLIAKSRTQGLASHVDGGGDDDSDSRKQNVEYLKKKLFLLTQQLTDVRSDLAACRATRDQEMATVIQRNRQLNDRITDLDARAKKIVLNFHKSCEENEQVCSLLLLAAGC